MPLTVRSDRGGGVGATRFRSTTFHVSALHFRARIGSNGAGSKHFSAICRPGAKRDARQRARAPRGLPHRGRHVFGRQEPGPPRAASRTGHGRARGACPCG
jgi:hypothetical protein